MRRKDRQVVQWSEQMAILQSCTVCRLGLIDHGRAYMVPMNFGILEREGKVTLYFHCATQGHKLDCLACNPQASFEADCDHQLVRRETCMGWTYQYRSVMGYGNLRRVEAVEEKQQGLACLMAHYGGGQVPPPSRDVLDRTTVLALDVLEMTGKANVSSH